MAITAEYLPTESAHRNPSDFTPELSRRARGVDVWAALRALGRGGLAEMVERNCARRGGSPKGSRAAGYEMLNEVVLNQVLVAFGDPERTRRVIAAHPGGRHLLVRRHRVAGTHRDAHQRVLVGDHR